MTNDVRHGKDPLASGPTMAASQRPRIGRKEVTMAPAVLIADADAELCDLGRRFFARHGWLARTAGGGVDCLAQLRQLSPQLLILDLALPWGGADGLLAVMRDDPGLARIPVVLTSVDASSPEALSGLVSPPVVQALREPLSLMALLEIVRPASGKRKSR
jgi:CheY-like chemotaxis protein